ncbi:polysaccharide degrading enzyme [Rahnella aquatilis]|nr:polysaccharide degrading enzyme [Rahnella aquatilis]
MKLKYIAALVSLSLVSASAMAELKANDDTNQIEGTNGATMMRTTDNGATWLVFGTTTDGESYGVGNNFPGRETVVVANLDYNVINTPSYDADKAYSTPQTKVRYNGYYWTNQWWANPGEVPGENSVWLKGEPTNLQSNILGTYYFTPWTGEKALQYQADTKAKVAAQRKVIGYFPEWGVYEAHNYFTPDKIATDQISHLNYGFAVIKNGVITAHDTAKAPELMKEIADIANYRGITNMLSIGGWDNSQEGVFEAATATQEGTERLAQSIVDYVLKWKFHGVDIDWEYPDNDQEKAQFTNLIKVLRSKLDTAGLQNDIYFQLSAAVTTNHKNIEFINPAETTPLLDSVNVMAYDIHGAFDPITGHNAPLYANRQDADPKLNVSSAMHEYATTWQVPKSKLMMGIPYYGRAWGDVAATEIIPGLPGLFATGSASIHGAWDDVGEFTGTNPWYVLKDKLANADYARYWDSESGVPYLYNATTKEFITYDDPQSVQEKVDYINAQGFGGAIIWDLSGDTSSHELGAIVKSVLSKPVDEPHITNLQAGRDVANDKASLVVKWDMDRSSYNNKNFKLLVPSPTAKETIIWDFGKGEGATFCASKDTGGDIISRCLSVSMFVEPGVVVSIVDAEDESKVYGSFTATQDMLNTAEIQDVHKTYFDEHQGKLTFNVDLDKDLVQSRQYLNLVIDHKDSNGKVTSSELSQSFYKMDLVGKNTSQYSDGYAELSFNHFYSTYDFARAKAGDEFSLVLADGNTPGAKRLKVLSHLTVTPEVLKK